MLPGLALELQTRQVDDRVVRDDERGLTLAGYLAFLDPPRDTARDALARRARLHVDRHFSLASMVNDTLDVYCALLGR